VKIVALYLANLKVALRYVLVLLAALLALIAVVLLSLPEEVFSANEIPQFSVALVYGDGTHDDMLIKNLNAEIEGIEVVDELMICTEQEADERLANDEVDVVVFLPDDTLYVLVYGGHATIEVRAKDPLIGSAAFAVVDRAVETLDEVQNFALIYERESRGHFVDEDARTDSIIKFDLILVSEAFTRMSSVEIPSSVSPYFVQVLTLLLFMVVSIASFFVAVLSARQYAQGYMRHLYVRGVRFGHVIVSQLLLSATIALVLGLVLGIILSFVASGLSLPALLVSSVLLSLVLTSLYLVFAGFRGQAQIATTRTLLGCLALLFFLLFAGGGFYPTALMQSDLRLFNPTWLSSQLSTWTLGGSVEPLQLLVFIVPFMLGCVLCFIEWRRAL
jgi:hypothetical protein